MKKIIMLLSFFFLLASCEAGNFGEKRNHLHNMGKEEICQKNPQRCIEVDGTQIDW